MSPRTRFALLGVGGLALAIAVGLLLALALRSINSGGERAALPAPATSPPAPVEPAPSAAPVEPAPPPRPEPKQNECVDALGDGVVDLDSVQLALHDGDLIAQFRFASGVPDDGGFGLTIVRGGKSYLLGVAVEGGDIDSVFVQDFDRSDTDDLDTDRAVIDGSTVTVMFPRDSIRRIGNGWSWSAFASQTGAEPDTCPGGDPQRFATP